MDMAFHSTNFKGKYQQLLAFVAITYCFSIYVISAGYPFLTLPPTLLCQRKSIIEPIYTQCDMPSYCTNPNDFNIKVDNVSTLDNYALKFDLYCNRSNLSALINSLYFLGAVTGVIIFAKYPDIIGRLPVFRRILICNIFLQLSFLFPLNMYQVLFTTFIDGVCTYNNSILSFLIVEHMDHSWSGIIMSAKSASYGFVGVFIGFYYLFINNLKLLFTFNLCLTILCYYITSTYLVESPRWLMAKNRYNESIECFNKIAVVNKTEEQLNNFLLTNSDLLKSPLSVTEVKQSRNILEILQLKSQQKRLFLMMYVYFFCTICVYGYLTSLNKSKGNIFVVGIMGLSAVAISEMSSGIFANYFGRIFMIKVLSCMGGVSFILFYFFGENWGITRTFLLFLTSFGFSGVLNLMYIYANEILPLSIKSLAFGLLFLLSRAGGVASPFVLQTDYYPLILGLLSLSNGVIMSTMEETLGRQLEEDVPEDRIEEFIRKEGGRYIDDNEQSSKFNVKSLKSLLLN